MKLKIIFKKYFKYFSLYLYMYGNHLLILNVLTTYPFYSAWFSVAIITISTKTSNPFPKDWWLAIHPSRINYTMAECSQRIRDGVRLNRSIESVTHFEQGYSHSSPYVHKLAHASSYTNVISARINERRGCVRLPQGGTCGM